MKASKFSDAQKAFIIKQGEEGTPVAEICRKAGISQATYFNWKKWRAPIGWSGLIVSASWASGPSARWFPAQADGSPMRCAA